MTTLSEHSHIDFPAHQIDIYQLDCTDALANTAIADHESIDVIVTSPPYNLGVSYSHYDDSIGRDEYLEWLGVVAERLWTTLAKNGSLFLNVSGKPSDQQVPFNVLDRMLNQGFQLQNTIHWIKSITVESGNGSNPHGDTETVIGHYKPINSQRYINDCHEYIFHLTKTGNVPLDRLAIGVPYKHKSNVKRWNSAGQGLHCRGNVWLIPYKTISNRLLHRPHPATFPPALPEMCMKLHGLERIGRVMDPFLGLGSTALACCDLEVDFVGFEIDHDYYAQAIETLRRRAEPPISADAE
jgi:site-specific DNA-methyltransferase (adenine-specific)